MSIIIPVSKHANLEDLQRLIRSVRNQHCKQVEVLIVSNKPLLPTEINEIAKVSNLIEKGSSYARNYGARLASGEILGFLDDDVVLDERWCEKVIQTFDDPSVGAVSGYAIVNAEGVNLDWVPTSLMWILGGSYWNSEGPKDVSSATGMNFCIRRNIFFHAGCFDERIGPRGDRPERGRWKRIGAEENDLALRILGKTGLRVLYNPEIRIEHKLRVESLRLTGLIRRALHVGHNRAFINKMFSSKRYERPENLVLIDTVTILLNTLISRRISPILFWKRFSFTCVVTFSVLVGYLIGKLEFRNLTHK